MKNIKIINIVVIVVAVIIAYNFIYKKQMAEVAQLSEQRDAEIKKNKLFKDLNAYEKKIASYKKVLSKKDPDAVMSGISNIARQSAVTIASLRPGEQSIGPDYTSTSFTASVSAADYDAMGKFVSRLENDGGMFLAVDNFKINSDKGASKSLLASLRITTYMLNEE